MDRKQSKKVGLTLCLTVLLLQLALGCVPTPSTVTPTPAPLRPEDFPFFPPNYVIVTGLQRAINDAAPNFSNSQQTRVDGQLRPEATLDLSYMNSLLNGQCSGLSSFELDPLFANDKVVTILYRIDPTPQGPTSVIDLVDYINRIEGVHADPVYLTGRHPEPLVGDPWIGGGSPWIGGGSPSGWPSQAQQVFGTQWAFGDSGIGLTNSVTGTRTVTYTGDGVRVGVFDTSPFRGPETQVVDWMNPKMELNLRPISTKRSNQDITSFIKRIESTLFQDQNKAQAAGKVQSSVQEHGLFVAGLIHAVAPASEIYLYPVLDEYGIGDLWTLNVALQDFIVSTGQMSGNPPTDLRGAVINLSLGSQSPKSSPRLADWIMIMGEPYGVRLARLSDARSLAIQVAAAHCLGIAVVAASGNDSGQRSGSASQSTPQTTPQPWPTPAQAEFPAIFPDAIAVAASCRERGRSCFSNQGEVAAPGGNGDDKCESGLGICKNNCQNRPDCGGDCPYGIIGPVTKSKDFESGYAYWAGTSFSAPLVSGLAALLLEKQKQGARIDIDDLIMAGTCGSKDGPGIINVPHALLAAPCPTPPAK